MLFWIEFQELSSSDMDVYGNNIQMLPFFYTTPLSGDLGP